MEEIQREQGILPHLDNNNNNNNNIDHSERRPRRRSSGSSSNIGIIILYIPYNIDIIILLDISDNI